MDESVFKISNPDRIERFMRRVCQAGLPILFRVPGTTGLAVKGRATQVLSDKKPALIRIANISPAGMERLATVTQVRVEFVMMSTKVEFNTVIVKREASSVLTAMPPSLYSIERRKNTRYPTKDDQLGFVKLSVWKPALSDMESMPTFEHLRGVAGYLSIIDISRTGLAIMTRYPSVTHAIQRGMIDDRAQLILPMQKPISVAFEVRWSKKIKDRVETSTGATRFSRFFRIGVEFVSTTDEANSGIAQFIQELVQSEAV